MPTQQYHETGKEAQSWVDAQIHGRLASKGYITHSDEEHIITTACQKWGLSEATVCQLITNAFTSYNEEQSHEAET